MELLFLGLHLSTVSFPGMKCRLNICFLLHINTCVLRLWSLLRSFVLNKPHRFLVFLLLDQTKQTSLMCAFKKGVGTFLEQMGCLSPWTQLHLDSTGSATRICKTNGQTFLLMLTGWLCFENTKTTWKPKRSLSHLELNTFLKNWGLWSPGRPPPLLYHFPASWFGENIWMRTQPLWSAPEKSWRQD